MKNTQKLILLSVITAMLMSSCASIIGGSKYNANIIVVDRPNAKIVYKGDVKGTGSATIKVKRTDANKFSFSVMEDGCAEQKYDYNSRTFRGWAFVGTIVGWTGLISGIPLPWGVVTDLSTGAVWKPNVSEMGISKENYKNFKYQVNYSTCTQNKTETSQQLQDVVYLKNGGVIRGIIIEQIPNSQLKIQTKDGNIFVYKFEEIEKMTKEQAK
jgi:hypothetical protein